jgi:lipopolysaccharide export system protein LptA
MRIWRSAALGLTLAAAFGSPGLVGAQIAPRSSGPMDISADNGSFVNATCESTWSGSAEVLQGTSRLRANVIRAFLKKKPGGPGGGAAGRSGGAIGGGAIGGLPGGPQSDCGATERIEAEGDVFYVTPDQTARGDRAVYTADNDLIVMTGNVIVVQGKNVVHGDRLTIHVATREAQMESEARGRGVPNRVRGVFYSNQPGAPGSTAAAPAPR